MNLNTKKGTILVIGALGQIGQELTSELSKHYGYDRVLSADIREPEHKNGHFIILDVTDKHALLDAVDTYHVKVIFNLAAILSAKGEQKPDLAWKINMDGLLNTLEAARLREIDRVFWPSSIAVFGPGSPPRQTPQETIMDPTSVYGISKLAGERWCAYYAEKHGVDVRSIRYPGLIGYKADPGGGTTDYAVAIFHEALSKGAYTCFLREDTELPMMYMPDAIRATLELMEAPADSIRIRSSYNLSGLSFTPAQLVEEIKKHLPDFTCSYAPDFRQAIADSWPESIDDSAAAKDWGWKARFDISAMVEDMLRNLEPKLIGATQATKS